MREKGSFVMHYLLLGGAIALEIFATTQLKLSEGFTKLGPSVLSLLGYGVCFFLFSTQKSPVNLLIDLVSRFLTDHRNDFFCLF